MYINQISIFLENRPGHLSDICRTLANNDISIITLALADTNDFGIVRMIVDDSSKAEKVLSAAGHVVNVREVVAVAVADRPGGMAEVMSVLDTAGVNIEYNYAFAFHHDESAVLVFRFADNAKAVAALEAAGVTLLGPGQIKNKA